MSGINPDPPEPPPLTPTATCGSGSTPDIATATHTMPSPPFSPSPRTAREWIKRGHHHSASGRAEDLSRALLCYDRARALCDPSTLDTDNLHDLGFAWMNRGNIMQQPGPVYDCVAALNAYDQALAVFLALAPPYPDLTNTIATVYLNRGRANQRLMAHAEAKSDYRKARTTLRPLVRKGDFAATRNFAGATVNLGQLQLAMAERNPFLLSKFIEARNALRPFATTDAITATLALELSRLELIHRELTLTRDSLSAFTDTLETALDLAVSWLPQSHPTALSIASILFRLGATAYARCQPQFLLEFLREALDPTIGAAPFAAYPSFHTIAADAVEALRIELSRPRVFDAETESSHHFATLLRALNQPTPWLNLRSVSS